MDEEQVSEMLTFLETEHIGVPTRLRKQLLSRRAQQLRDSSDFVGLIKMMNPFEPSMVFDMRLPSLCGLEIDDNEKTALYNEVVMQNVVVDLIKQGEGGSAKLLKLADEASLLMENVDLVEVSEMAIAKELGDHVTIWRAFVALLSDKLDLSKQDSGGTGLGQTHSDKQGPLVFLSSTSA